MKRSELNKIVNTGRIIDDSAGTIQPSNWNVAAALVGREPADLEEARKHIAGATVRDAAVTGALLPSLLILCREYDFELSDRKQARASKKAYKLAVSTIEPSRAARGATVFTLGMLELMIAERLPSGEELPGLELLQEIVGERLGELMEPDDYELLGRFRSRFQEIRERDRRRTQAGEEEPLPLEFNDAVAGLFLLLNERACGTTTVEGFTCVQHIGGFSWETIFSGDTGGFSWRTTSDLLLSPLAGRIAGDLLSSAQTALELLEEPTPED